MTYKLLNFLLSQLFIYLNPQLNYSQPILFKNHGSTKKGTLTFGFIEKTEIYQRGNHIYNPFFKTNDSCPE